MVERRVEQSMEGGARRPEALPSARERADAERELARATRLVTPLYVVAGALAGSAAFGLLLFPLIGLVYLVVLGVVHLFLGGPAEVSVDARPFLRVFLPLFAVVWPTGFVVFSLRHWRREVARLRRVAAGEGPVRTVATFASARFNTTEEKASFVNPGCYGDDVVVAVLEALREEGLDVDPEPGAEDFGWFGRFEPGPNDPHDLIVVFQPEDDAGAGTWLVHIERSGAPLSANRRRRGGAVQSAAVSAVHGVLARMEGVHELRWHFEGPGA